MYELRGGLRPEHWGLAGNAAAAAWHQKWLCLAKRSLCLAVWMCSGEVEHYDAEAQLWKVTHSVAGGGCGARVNLPRRLWAHEKSPHTELRYQRNELTRQIAILWNGEARCTLACRCCTCQINLA